MAKKLFNFINLVNVQITTLLLLVNTLPAMAILAMVMETSKFHLSKRLKKWKTILQSLNQAATILTFLKESTILQSLQTSSPSAPALEALCILSQVSFHQILQLSLRVNVLHSPLQLA